MPKLSLLCKDYKTPSVKCESKVILNTVKAYI